MSHHPALPFTGLTVGSVAEAACGCEEVLEAVRVAARDACVCHPRHGGWVL